MKKLARCEHCNRTLISFSGMWVHPEVQCKEEDGLQLSQVDEFMNKKFVDKYGKPEHSQEEYISNMKKEYDRKEAILLSELSENTESWFQKIMRWIFNGSV